MLGRQWHAGCSAVVAVPEKHGVMIKTSTESWKT